MTTPKPKQTRRQYRATHRRVLVPRRFLERRQGLCGCMVTVRQGESWPERLAFHYRYSAGCKRRVERE